MIPQTFELNGNTYAIGKINAFVQADIAAKIAPFIPIFVEMIISDRKAAERIAAEGGEKKSSDLSDLLIANFDKIAAAVARMPKEDRDAVFKQCLSVVTRQSPGGVGWQPIWNAQAEQLQFDDIDDLIPTLTIVGKVIGSKLGNFTGGGLSF